MLSSPVSGMPLPGRYGSSLQVEACPSEMPAPGSTTWPFLKPLFRYFCINRTD